MLSQMSFDQQDGSTGDTPEGCGFPSALICRFLCQDQRFQGKLSVFHVIVEKTGIISEEGEKLRENTSAETSLAS